MSLSTEEVKDRVNSMLLAELKRHQGLQWYYISVATEAEFLGAYFIEARGQTEAWTWLHTLGWYPRGSNASTKTVGPVEPDKMRLVPVAMRWRRLSKNEALTLKEDQPDADPVPDQQGGTVR